MTVSLLLSGCSPSDPAAEAPDACSGLKVTVAGTDGDDRLKGTPGPDVIAGDDGNDVIDGLGGDDVVCGGAGADRLNGGAGDDIVDGGLDERYEEDADYYQWAGDSLTGGPGDDELIVGDHQGHDPVDELIYADAHGPVTVDLNAGSATGGAGTDRIAGEVAGVLGSPYDDRLLGTAASERLMGWAGGDVIEGRGGDDRLDAVGQADQLFGPTPATIDAATDVNVLRGGPGRDEIGGGDGRDTLTGGPGDDTMSGEAGPDRVLGGTGNDQVGDTAIATTEAGAQAQLLDGGPGRDRISGVFLALTGRPQDVFTDVTGTLDLAAGTLTASGVAPGRRAGFAVPVRSFEDASTSPGTWTMYGTDGPNRIIAFDEKHPVVLRACGGDDELAGTFRDDVLDGGSGSDSARGYTGKDRYVSIENKSS
jgi:Ca2+-binding RTX toxin-like protein